MKRWSNQSKQLSFLSQNISIFIKKYYLCRRSNLSFNRKYYCFDVPSDITMSDRSSDTGFSSDNNPRHFIVLDAIAGGMKEVSDIAKATRLPREEVKLIINDLLLQRSIIKEEKKRRFFGSKKLEIKATDAGVRMLNSKKQELQQQAEQLRQWQRNGNTTQLQSYMESDYNRSWIPFMLISGIMNVLFFTSMMSMMGMALNPMESQMARGSGAGSEGAGESETDSSSSTGTEGGDVVDAGGADFGGFDGGGFGDF
jgi:hypothetical protein